MKKKSILLLALTVVLVLAAAIQPAIAYFTTYAQARGNKPLSLGDTWIEERFEEWVKYISVHNEPGENGGMSVYVRARAFSGAAYPLSYDYDETYWVEGNDGYYYYTEILEPGMSTGYDESTGVDRRLKVSITRPAQAEDGDSFNVPVVYETVPVVRDGGTLLPPVVTDSNGNLVPRYAAWEGGDEA